MPDHTPAKWYHKNARVFDPYGRAGPGPSFTVWGPHAIEDRYIVATVWGESVPAAEAEANARLMAAAPDLLTMLRQLHRLMTVTGDRHIIRLKRDEVLRLESLIEAHR